MKQAEIYTKRQYKKVQHLMGYPEFISRGYLKRNVIYMPVGEFRGKIILVEYETKKEGTYLILK